MTDKQFPIGKFTYAISYAENCTNSYDNWCCHSRYSPNGSSAEVDTETASTILNLMVLSELSFSLLVDADTLDKVVHCFHALREFALNHPNSATILKLID